MLTIYVWVALTIIEDGLVEYLRFLLHSLTICWMSSVYYRVWNLFKGFSLKFQGISTSRILLADATPISSPLIPISATSSGTNESQTENQAVKPKPEKVQAILKGIKQVIFQFGFSVTQSLVLLYWELFVL